MLLVYFTIGLVLVFIVNKIIKSNHHSTQLAAFPMFKKQFLISHSALINKVSTESMLTAVTDWHKRLGNVFVMQIHEFIPGAIFVADPKIAEILSNHRPTRTGSFSYNVVSKIFGGGSFMSSDSKRMRFSKASVNATMLSFKMANRYSNKAVELSKRFEGPTNFYTFWKHLLLDFAFGKTFIA
jgi:hypothetical protein